MKEHPMSHAINPRRRFLRYSALTGTGLLLSGVAGCTALGDKSDKDREKSSSKQQEDVSPAEDLMREHGVLKRVLLVYTEVIRRIDAGQDLPSDEIQKSARIIRTFVEDYHEKLEEDYLFPRFRQSHTLVDLADTLYRQHQAGRKLTDITMRYASAGSLRDVDDKHRLRDSLAQFIRMYNPHEAREDTVLFPAFRKLVSQHEYDALGEEFENKEHQLFGQDGFEKYVDQIAGIEKSLGIYDLAQFTPKV
jgi:hemerythrin-like domain-containing protein